MALVGTGSGGRHCYAVGCSNGDYKLSTWPKRQCQSHSVPNSKCLCPPPFELFSFPPKSMFPEKRKSWLLAFSREDPKNPEQLLEPKHGHRVCSIHFVDNKPTNDHPDPELHLCRSKPPHRKSNIAIEEPIVKRLKQEEPVTDATTDTEAATELVEDTPSHTERPLKTTPLSSAMADKDEDITMDSSNSPATSNFNSNPGTPVVPSNPGTPRSDLAEVRATPPPQALQRSIMPPQPQSKYTQLLAVIEDMGRDIRPTYSGSKSSAERLKRGIVHARILVRECLLECERSARN